MSQRVVKEVVKALLKVIFWRRVLEEGSGGGFRRSRGRVRAKRENLERF